MEYCSRTKRRKVKKAVDDILTNLTNDEQVDVYSEDHNINNVERNIFYGPASGLVVAASSFYPKRILANTNISWKKLFAHMLIHLMIKKILLLKATDCDTDLDDESSLYTSDTDISDLDEENGENEFDIRDKLSKWYLTYNIAHTAMSSLLQILRDVGLDVPKDPRTLLHIPNDIPLQSVAGGSYYHCGVANDIISQLQKCSVYASDKLSLNINIDGIPLLRSSNRALWPILAKIVELPECSMLVVGLFAGTSKPSSAAEYLKAFVHEMKQLLVEGINYLGKHYTLAVHAVICDAPARFFIKCIKGHGGYHACERCCQEGEYVGRKVTYPEINSRLRSDADFLSQRNEDHHMPKLVSPLAAINIGLVSQVPLDYVHLVCLGVVRRLVSLWMKGDLECRLPSHKINNISSNLLSLRNTMPRELSRKPRTMSEFRHWKATELRQFLLYTGPVVLCDILPKQTYQNFVTLSVAINCLVSPDFAGKVEYQNYAEKLLINFVLNFKQIYGASQLVYNVHSLIHLAQDCRKFGVLDNVSAFPYENYLGILKKWVRRPQNPIAQIVCRIAEKESIIKHN